MRRRSVRNSSSSSSSKTPSRARSSTEAMGSEPAKSSSTVGAEDAGLGPDCVVTMPPQTGLPGRPDGSRGSVLRALNRPWPGTRCGTNMGCQMQFEGTRGCTWELVVAGRRVGESQLAAFQTSYAGSVPVARSRLDQRKRWTRDRSAGCRGTGCDTTVVRLAASHNVRSLEARVHAEASTSCRAGRSVSASTPASTPSRSAATT